MTKANSLDPPKLVTRLMEQFSPILNNAALAGDLMEAFKQGRSSGWYWRQVFWAILIALLNLFKKRWSYLAYAALGSGLISITWIFMLSVGPSSALRTVFAPYAKGYGIQWPWSLVYQIAFLTIFQGVIVASALIAYLACFRIVNREKVLRALILIVVVLASGNVASTLLGNRISTAPTELVPSIPASCEVKITREGVSVAELMQEGQVKCRFILSGIRFSYVFVWMLFSTPAMLALLVGIWEPSPVRFGNRGEDPDACGSKPIRKDTRTCSEAEQPAVAVGHELLHLCAWTESHQHERSLVLGERCGKTARRRAANQSLSMRRHPRPLRLKVHRKRTGYCEKSRGRQGGRTGLECGRGCEMPVLAKSEGGAERGVA